MAILPTFSSESEKLVVDQSAQILCHITDCIPQAVLQSDWSATIVAECMDP